MVPFRKNKSIIGLILIWKITDGYWHNLVKWSWPTQPEFGPEFSPWGPTRPNSTQFWTQRAKSDLKTSRVRFNSGILGNYRVEFEFEPFLRSTQRNWTRFRSCGPTRPVWTQKLGPKSGWTKKKNGSGLAALLLILIAYPIIDLFLPFRHSKVHKVYI